VSNQEVIAVIGSGAGGLPAATALAELDHHVVLIEKGNYLKPSQTKTNSYDYEINNTPWNVSSKEWQGNIELQRGVGIGGSTLYYQAVMSKVKRHKLKAWGIDIHQYTKYENEVIKKLNIAGIEQPHHKLNPIASRLMKSLNQLKWSAQQTDVAILSKSVGSRPSCVNCGLCIYGCLPGDKSGTHNIWLPDFVNTKSNQIMTNTHAVSIELSNEKTARAINLISNGKEVSLPVKAVVVSAGALETPHLLLQSRQKHAPHGIGNKHVGRNMRTSLMYSQLVSLGHVEGSSAAGIPIDIVVEEFEKEGLRLYQGKNLAGITGPVSAAKFYANKFGISGQRKWMRENYTKLAGLAGVAESDAHYDDGLTSGKSFYKSFTEKDLHKMQRAETLVEQWRVKADAEKLFSSPIGEKSLQGSMLRGTCRMGAEPEDNAVSATGKLNGYDNIYISDASILGQGMISDPTLTLQSLGYYIGTTMDREYRQ